MSDLKRMSFPKEIKEVLTAPIPAALIKTREGGGKKILSYLSGSTVTDMLNHAFGYMWSWETEKEWVADSIPFFNSYSKIPEDQKIMVNGKKGAWEDQGPVAHVKGRLTVFFERNEGPMIAISKTGLGSKSVLGKQNDQESIFKAAGTDALKKAASLFGIGLELYRGEEEQEYFEAMNYEDPWTDEMKTLYATEREYINDLIENQGLEVADLDDMMLEFSEGAIALLEYVTPDIISSFVEFIKAKAAEAQG
jgi:hypothetical protein